MVAQKGSAIILRGYYSLMRCGHTSITPKKGGEEREILISHMGRWIISISLILKKSGPNLLSTTKKERENQVSNRQIDNKLEWNNKREEEIEEDSSNKSPLFLISSGIFKWSYTIQPRTMPLDIYNRLLAIHMIFGTYDANEATICTRVNSCAVMNFGNLKLN